MISPGIVQCGDSSMPVSIVWQGIWAFIMISMPVSTVWHSIWAVIIIHETI